MNLEDHLGDIVRKARKAAQVSEEAAANAAGLTNWPEDAPHVAIVGDTIFAGSLGTGFQSTELLKRNVREQIFSLPLETLIAAGHGPFTTVQQEKEHNPFFA